ncbi:MAG: protease inhibitor I42 family protein [Nitrospirota bacterium]
MIVFYLIHSVKKFWLAVFLLSLSIMPIFSCASKPAENLNAPNVLILKNQDNGRKVAISKGDLIQIELERSGSTGYEWYLDDVYKTHFDLIKEVKQEIVKKGFVGTPVITAWQFKAMKQGNADIKIRLYRDWEGKEKAAAEFHVSVIIR